MKKPLELVRKFPVFVLRIRDKFLVTASTTQSKSSNGIWPTMFGSTSGTSTTSKRPVRPWISKDTGANTFLVSERADMVRERISPIGRSPNLTDARGLEVELHRSGVDQRICFDSARAFGARPNRWNSSASSQFSTRILVTTLPMSFGML